MKLRIEISDGLPDEVVIRSSSCSDEVKRLQLAFESVMGRSELALTSGGSEFFVPVSRLLFFETDDGRVAAHTADRMYYSDEKLYELEKLLPHSFVRVSKSCILNSEKVESINRSVTGTASVTFSGSYKKAYISRMYYKILKDIIYETRLSK